MKKRILFVLALFLMLTGFNGGDRIVEQNGVTLQEGVGDEYCAPTIIEKPKILTSDDGNTAILQVRFKANPNASVTWYRYSLVVGADSRHQILLKKESADVMRATLEIKYPTSEDAGIYKVRIKNDLGETSAEFLLTI